MRGPSEGLFLQSVNVGCVIAIVPPYCSSAASRPHVTLSLQPMLGYLFKATIAKFLHYANSVCAPQRRGLLTAWTAWSTRSGFSRGLLAALCPASASGSNDTRYFSAIRFA